MSPKRTLQKLPWVRVPRQQRSDRSLRRILDAAEEIMESKDYSEITVAEIVKRAHSSIGVFYSRFPDKLALLHHLDERFAEEAEEAIDHYLNCRDWKGCTLAQASKELIEFLCGTHYAKRGMLKSIILQVRLHPNQRFQQAGRRLISALDRMAGFLHRWRDEIADPNPERALRMALVMVISTIRDYLVFSETTLYRDFIGIDLDEFPAALNQTFLHMIRARCS